MGQYSTVNPLSAVLPTWVVSDEDRQRIAAYQRYEDMYWNDPAGYEIIQRGTEGGKLYVPSAMTIIESVNRYLAKGWTFSPDPMLGTPADREAMSAWLTRLFRREKVHAKFLTQKRYGLIRGDAVWYLVGDPNKPQGRRLRVLEVDPASYFPIKDPADEDRTVGVHLVEQTLARDEKTVIIKRQTYRKLESGQISYDLSWWQLGAWDDRNQDPKDLKLADDPPSPPASYVLPPAITQLPVYHVQNQRVPGATFGSSEMRGMEVLAAAVSQTISDEELALALAGLGLYVTTSGPPVDEDGNETDWIIGPGMVAEIDEDSTWQRVKGIDDVTPSLDHAKFLEAKMREARGVPDVALGNVDVQVAESGIALALKMAPILSANAEKEVEMLGTYDQLLYDLVTMWFPAYEGISFNGAVPVSVIEDPLPVNRAAVLLEITTLVDKGLITLEYARQLLSERLGMEFPAEMGEAVVDEMTALAQARNADPFLDRVGRELEGVTGE